MLQPVSASDSIVGALRCGSESGEPPLLTSVDLGGNKLATRYFRLSTQTTH
jgi:hypothetical protein